MGPRVKQKVFEALHALVSNGDIDQRIFRAAGCLVKLDDNDVPGEFQAEFHTIRARLLPIAPTEGRATPPKIAARDAEDLARRILWLFAALCVNHPPSTTMTAESS
jgi:hypothetical protein